MPNDVVQQVSGFRRMLPMSRKGCPDPVPPMSRKGSVEKGVTDVVQWGSWVQKACHRFHARPLTFRILVMGTIEGETSEERTTSKGEQ